MVPSAHAAARGNDALDLIDADEIVHLDSLSVQGRDEVGAGWRPTRSSTATRTNVPLEDVPRAVSVVTAEVMADLGEERIDRALDFVGGVTRGNDFGGMNISGYNVRGFTTGAMYRNGFSSGKGTNSQPDAATLERVEVLKGPASGLFGRGEPGGLVNLVTKQPRAERFTRISSSVGSWDRYRATLDTNSPLNASGSLLGRFNMALEDNGSFRDFIEIQRYVFAPSLSWQITAKTLLLIDGQYVRNDNVFDRGIPAIDGHFGQVRIKNFYGEPSSGKIKNKNQSLQTSLEHQLNEHWKLRLAGQFYHGHLQGAATEPSAPLAATPHIVRRFYRVRNFEWQDLHNHAEVHGQFSLFGWEHQVLIGVEYELYRSDMIYPATGSTNAYGVDIFEPSKDHGKPPPAFTSLSDSFAREESYAINIQDQIYFTPNLIGSLGLRYDSVETSSQNRVTGNRSSYDRDATVPRAGLLYKFTPQVSAFANVSRSFKPNGVDSNGEVYAPEKGIGYEVGSKLNLFGGRLGATLGFFQITKENVKTPHPDPLVIDSITVGEQRSRGFDMQVSGKLTDALRLIAAYAYIDAKVTRDNRANYTGNRLAGVPLHNASLFAVYELPHGFEIGSAYTHTDARKANVTSDFELPGYQTVDLFARWRVNGRVNLTLNLYNLFDKEYYARGWGTWAGVPGDPRSFKLTANLKF
ncbi:TonB-dependent siderophore receptor [Cephaloticoccus primus]|uniref:TonB-dependent siderophore receptor n=1 Tax=Cephaloticoccus primus TaxID=1548207 RepID=UPI0008380970|nr:TonB-dependent siderophore receptor [Cephaloticoccus primus]